jgi:Skp family chaperone for outer membrane proteins
LKLRNGNHANVIPAKAGIQSDRNRWIPAYAGMTAVIWCVMGAAPLRAVEIPLESLTPARIGYVDLQKVFDTYPEKSFAEGDLLREIEKRKREMGQRQNLINTIRQQITADESALSQGAGGQAVLVPMNNVPDLTPPPPAAMVSKSTSTVKGSTPSAANVEPYPLDDPLAGLPGHDATALLDRTPGSRQLPGMRGSAKPMTTLDLLAAATGPVLLNPEAQSALQRRIADNKKWFERQTAEFRNFRANAIGDMKVLQTQKTYGVMSRIYAVLQTLARDEGVTVVMDKAFVLYGEDTVDLSDKLIARLQQTENP